MCSWCCYIFVPGMKTFIRFVYVTHFNNKAYNSDGLIFKFSFCFYSFTPFIYCEVTDDLLFFKSIFLWPFSTFYFSALYYLQNKSEGKLFERFKINWKFGNLISAIIEKSWPRDRRGIYQEDEELVLQHLLSWTAAKNIFQLHGILSGKNKSWTCTHQINQFSRIGLLNIVIIPYHDYQFKSENPPTVENHASVYDIRADVWRCKHRKHWRVISVIAGAEEKLIEKLSQDARDRIAIAISAFTAINNQLVNGSIKTSLLNIILEKRAVFLDLLKIGNNTVLVIKNSFDNQKTQSSLISYYD